MSFIWVMIIILLVIAEIISVNLTTIWYVISALISLILSFFIDSFMIEFAVFAIIGTILLFTTKPFVKKYLKQSGVKTNFDRIIGMRGVVTEEILKNKNGEVKVDGKLWTAYSDKKIKVDSIVEILEINGVKIKVKEVDE